MVVIGITGGIGAGKGLATEFFRARGAAIIDADQVSRDLAKPGSDLLQRIAAAFGADVIRPDGTLDRERLGRVVFGDPQALATLNRITHPPIMAEIQRRLDELRGKGCVRVACVVAPLLIEAGGRQQVDRVLLVVADEEERVRRVMARDGIGKEQVRRRMAAQMPTDRLRRHADWVVDTTAGREAAREQLEAVWAQIAALAGECLPERGRDCRA